MNSFFKELQERWKAETPAFFKIVTRIGKYLSGVGVALTAIPQTIPNGVWLESISLIGTYVLTIGIVLVIVSQSTKIDK